MQDITLIVWIYCMFVGLVAGGIKGLLGFAMPLVMITGLGLVVDPVTTLAALIMPTMISNVWQSLRQGWQAALKSIRDFRVFMFVGAVSIVLSAQLINEIPIRTLYFILGVIVVTFSILMISKWHPKNIVKSAPIEIVVGLIGGFAGGLSGVWGPPTVMYLTAIETPKVEQVRVQGIVFGLGSVLLAVSHLFTGVLNAERLPLSIMMVVPSLIGMGIGLKFQDKIDQTLFRKLTLFFLLLAGLNLLRRSLF